MNKKMVAIILAVLAVGVVIYWAAAGASLWTQTKVAVQVKDELFGTTSTEWRDQFVPGLEYVGPIVGVLLIGSVALFWLDRRQRRLSAS
jgi:hypothetical protein